MAQWLRSLAGKLKVSRSNPISWHMAKWSSDEKFRARMERGCVGVTDSLADNSCGEVDRMMKLEHRSKFEGIQRACDEWTPTRTVLNLTYYGKYLDMNLHL